MAKLCRLKTFDAAAWTVHVVVSNLRPTLLEASWLFSGQNSNFLFSTNNYLNTEMKVTKKGEFYGKHGGYGGATAKPRNQLLWDLLNNYHGDITVDFAKMVTRFPGNGPPYPPEGGWETVYNIYTLQKKMVT